MTFAKQLAITLVVVLVGTVLSQAGDSTLDTAESPFRSGDRVAFIGDSITAWGQYTSIIQLFCQARFPDQAFRIYNSAHAGDRAIYTRLRADEAGSPFHKVIPESIRESESLNDQAWKAAVPTKHHYELVRTDAPEGDDGSTRNGVKQGSTAKSGFDLKAHRKAALERREWLQNLLADYLKKHPESDLDGDGKLTSHERSIHVAKLYRIDVLKRLGESVQFIGDIEYAKVDDESLTLDLYLPPKIDPDNRPPLVVWFHGGGWRGGSKDQCDVYWLATNGFAVASVEYRSTLNAPFPNNIHDCKAAIRWLRANADEHGYDGERIGTSGGSAGGHLAVLLGTSAGVKSLEGTVGGNLKQPSRVHAAVSMAGVMRVDDWPRSHLGLSTILGLTHGEDNGAYELARLCSPDEHLTQEDPPMLLLHGDKDSSVPRRQSEDFHAKYTKAGLTSTLRILPNTKHVSPNFTDSKRQRIIVNFFRRHLCDSSSP